MSPFPSDGGRPNHFGILAIAKRRPAPSTTSCNLRALHSRPASTFPPGDDDVGLRVCVGRICHEVAFRPFIPTFEFATEPRRPDPPSHLPSSAPQEIPEAPSLLDHTLVLDHLDRARHIRPSGAHLRVRPRIGLADGRTRLAWHDGIPLQEQEECG